MWALVNGQTLVNKKACEKKEKWQYQDNFFSLPQGYSADDKLASGDFILEISKPRARKLL